MNSEPWQRHSFTFLERFPSVKRKNLLRCEASGLFKVHYPLHAHRKSLSRIRRSISNSERTFCNTVVVKAGAVTLSMIEQSLSVEKHVWPHNNNKLKLLMSDDNLRFAQLDVGINDHVRKYHDNSF